MSAACAVARSTSHLGQARRDRHPEARLEVSVREIPPAAFTILSWFKVLCAPCRWKLLSEAPSLDRCGGGSNDATDPTYKFLVAEILSYVAIRPAS